MDPRKSPPFGVRKPKDIVIVSSSLMLLLLLLCSFLAIGNTTLIIWTLFDPLLLEKTRLYFWQQKVQKINYRRKEGFFMDFVFCIRRAKAFSATHFLSSQERSFFVQCYTASIKHDNGTPSSIKSQCEENAPELLNIHTLMQ